MITLNKGFVSIAAASVLFVAACASQVDDSKTAGSAAGESAASAAVSPAVLEAGRAVYKTNCVACHGESGKAMDPAPVSSSRPRAITRTAPT